MWCKIILISLFIIPFDRPADPERGIMIDLEFAPEFQASGLANLITLTFNSSDQTPVLLYTLTNASEADIEQFYLEVAVKSENTGDLLLSRQNSNYGIRIPAGASISFTNLDIIRGTVPGVQGQSKFDFSLTSDARNMLAALRAGAPVDDDRFVVDVKVFKSDGSGERYLSSGSVEFETTLSPDEIAITPAPESNNRLSNIDLRNEKPMFEWHGLEHLTYRLVIVSTDEERNVEEDLNRRFSRQYSPSNVRDLSENVYLDILIRGNVFELPEDLADVLEQGRCYAWQVRSSVRTTHGSVEVASDIWHFSTNKVLDDELIDLLSALFGHERVQRMVDNGLQLHKIELEGKVYAAHEAVEVLREMKQKINNNRATIGE
jgi:hypothetical protein